VKKDEIIPAWKSLTLSALAGAGAGFITNPLDMAKLRMQVDRATKASLKVNGSATEAVTLRFGYKNMLAGIASIYNKEGILALFKGFNTESGDL
jgi:hypothetical protein